MKRFAVTLFMLVLPVLIFAQAPNSLWNRTYGGSGMDICRSVQQTTDGGYILAGETSSFGSGNADCWLVKTDANGDSLWSRTFGWSNDDQCFSVQQTTDGGYILAGGTTSFVPGMRFLLIKTNASGDSLWSRHFGGGGEEVCFSVQQTTDGGYILGGITTAFGAGGLDFWMVKTNANGDSLWSRTFGGGNHDQCSSVQQTTDGGYILAGLTRSFGAGFRNIWLVKTDSIGIEQWNRTFSRSGSSVICNSVQQTTEGGYILGGADYIEYGGGWSSYVWLVKTDVNGDSLWTRTFGGIYQGFFALAQQTSNGGYVSAGSTNSFGAGGFDSWLIRTDASGDSLWRQSYGGSSDDYCNALLQTTDGAYILAGSTQSSGAGSDDFWLLKTLPEREPCPPTSLPFLDNFDSPTLDSCWFWIREDTSHWSLTERPGWMRIWTQGGDMIHDANLKNLLLRPRPSGSFVMETMLALNPVDYQNAGLLLYMGDSQHAYLHRGPGGIFYEDYTNGQLARVASAAMSDTSVYLRIKVLGASLLTEWSPDAVAWNVLVQDCPTWVNQSDVRLGMVAHNGVAGGYSAPSMPADFDYFKLEEIEGTNICGDVSGVWDTTGSPYYVTCDVTVPAGQTLEIQPGVQVLFTGHYKFNVNGNLQAIGTEQDSIIFTRAFPTEESKWWGIRIIGAQDTSRFLFSRFSYGKATPGRSYDTEGGAINVVQSNVEVSNCRFFSNYALDAGGAVFLRQVVYANISQCLFDGNSADDQNGGAGAGAIECAASDNTRIERCLFFSNSTATNGGAIVTDACSPVISHCSFIANSAQAGAAIYAWLAVSPPTVINCIAWTNYGIPLGSNSVPFAVTYSDIQGDYPGIGNIDTDPMFVDSANDDFHLQAGSPCIDAGDPNSPLDPDYTRADMGAFYFPQPNLLVSPGSIDFGSLDLGMDSIQTISLYNPTIYAVPINTIFHSIPDFIIDTTGLGGQVDSHETYYMTVTFMPLAVGTYIDTLTIVAEQVGDDTIRIPLSGEADVIPMPVEGLVIQRGPLNGIQLRWPPVTHSISGQPITADYIIYGTTSLDGPFVPFGYATDTSYAHPYILNIQSIYFYYVTAIPEGVLNLDQIQEILKATRGEVKEFLDKRSSGQIENVPRR